MFSQILCFIISCFSLFSCVTEEQAVYLIPEGYQGSVLIIFDQADGVPVEYKKRKIIYRMPSNGVLRTQAKANYRISSEEYFYVNEKGKKTEIPYSWPKQLESTENNVSNTDTMSNKIYAYGSEMGSGADRNGKDARFRTWVIGPLNKSDSLLQEKDRFVTRELTGMDFWKKKE